MTRRCVFENIILYSPPGVLFIWAAVLAEENRRMSRDMLILFIVLLAVALAAAETVRLNRRKRKERGKQ